MAEASAYFDTSVLIKRYVEEPGLDHARRLMRRYRLLSSVITSVEAVSALCRRHRAGEFIRKNFDAIIAIQADLLGPGRARRRVLEGAERLNLTDAGPALDALHIASALVLQMESGASLPFVTADARQREAADHAGLKVVWVT